MDDDEEKKEISIPIYDKNGVEIGTYKFDKFGDGLLPIRGSTLDSMGPLSTKPLPVDYRTGRPAIEIRDFDGNFRGMIDVESNRMIFDPYPGLPPIDFRP